MKLIQIARGAARDLFQGQITTIFCVFDALITRKNAPHVCHRFQKHVCGDTMKNKFNSAILALPLVVAGTALAHAEERRTYELNGFEMVEAHNGIDVAIQQGDTFSIVAKSNKASHLDDLKITPKWRPPYYQTRHRYERV